jgi:hypothetical protein
MDLPDVSDLPAQLAWSLTFCRNAGRRFYVASHPDFPRGVLRDKDAAGLLEWNTRTWNLFSGAPPTITDVTDQVPGMWRAILAIPRNSPVQIVWRAPAGLTVLSGVAPATGDIVIGDGAPPMDPVGFVVGVTCYGCGWVATPVDPRVGGDLTQSQTVDACAGHLVAAAHGDQGWIEAQTMRERIYYHQLPLG